MVPPPIPASPPDEPLESSPQLAAKPAAMSISIVVATLFDKAAPPEKG
jgi:hypothetical protein